MKDTTQRQQGNVHELERRVLDAARSEEPSALLSARMAGALGLSLNDLPPEPPDASGQLHGNPTGQELTGASATGNPVWSSCLPWVSGVVAIAVAAGVIVATRGSGSTKDSGRLEAVTTTPIDPAHAEPPPRVSLPVVPQAEVSNERFVDNTSASKPSSRPVEPEEANNSSRSTSRVRADLRAEIAVVDAARAAVQDGAQAPALSLLSEYDSQYPKGSFRPEVTALRIEALAKSGRNKEASNLARQFVVKHRGSPLAERVAKYQ